MIKTSALGLMKTLDFTTDLSTTQSKCRICSELMPKKSKRIVMNATHTYKQHMNGGGCKFTRWFFHPSCFFQSMSAPITHCFECGSDEHMNQHVQTAPYNGLCKLCILNVRLGTCCLCGEVNDVRSLSHAAPNSPIISESYLHSLSFNNAKYCKVCEKNCNIETERSLRRIVNQERAMMYKLRNVKSDLEAWTNDTKCQKGLD